MKKLPSLLFGCISAALLNFAGAQPAITPDQPVMDFDDLGVFLVGYALRGQAEVQMPLGWSGFFDEQTGIACEPFGAQEGRRAFLLHCPWRHGTGIAFQQFTFALPSNARAVRLRGATAMRSENVTNSDGVTFRVYANGRKLLNHHQTNDVWRAFDFDLSGLRGSNVTVRFEVDPGPGNNPSFDYSLWGQRELVIEGLNPPSVTHPQPPPLVLSNLWSGQTTDLAPSSGFSGSTSVSSSNGVAHLHYQGPDGILDYEWRLPHSDNDGLFGALTLHTRMRGGASVTVPLANSAALTWNQPATPIASGWTETNVGCALWRTFEVGSKTATVRIAGQLIGKTLELRVSCSQPEIAGFESGSWGPVIRRRQIAVPYYSRTVHYLPAEDLFVNTILDWASSGASSHSGTLASYAPLTDGTHNLLQERVLFTAAWHLAEVLPNPPNTASPWRDFLANKVVLDIWGGTFTNIAENLERLAGYDITNCVAIIHNWQRSGYDNALPMHYPANPSYGGDAGMSYLVETGRQLGVRCALHENYVDYYPNYDFYSTNEIALDSAGKKVLAWYQPGTKIQSFAVKPNAILPLAAAQSPEIHRRYQTEANYLDVHSAVPPWFHVDSRAGETGAGRLTRVWEVHRQLWDYERRTHGGPVFGEGNAHWYWSGALDGVEAQFGTGWPEHGGFTAPLTADFDLLKIHPLQFNHGMGYYSRWWPKENYRTNWGGPVPMVVLDRYRMQEVAYGHAGFLDGSVYANIPIAWLEHHLLSPVMARYATARPVEIQYGDNRAWRDATAAAKSGNPEAWSRVRIRYENGLTVLANGSSNVLAAGNRLLPSLGWIAEGSGVTAGTILRNGVVTDFADTGDSLFVNARAARDWNLSSYRRIRPSVASFQQTGRRSFRASYAWQVQDLLDKDYQSFVHFSRQGEIRAQQDHAVNPPSSGWRLNQTITDGPWEITLPSALADGDYEWLTGLFDANAGGGRVPLQGVDDGTTRIRLGVLHVGSSGSRLSFSAETNGPATDPATWYAQHLNTSNAVVDFEDVATDGSVLLRRVADNWELKTWPRNRSFMLELASGRFGHPSKVQCVGGSAAEAIPVPTGSRWRLPLNGARAYRWTAP